MARTVQEQWQHYEPLILTKDEYDKLCVNYPQQRLYLRAIKNPTLHPIQRNAWAYLIVARMRGENWED